MCAGVSVIASNSGHKLKHFKGSLLKFFLEVVGIDPRNIRKIPENSKYKMHEICMKYA